METTAGELAAGRRRARRHVDRVMVLSLVVAVQIAWFGTIAYCAYRLGS